MYCYRSVVSLSIAVALGTIPMSSMSHAADFGMQVQQALHDQSGDLFGIDAPLAKSAEYTRAREPGQSAYDLITLAGGLQARILTREAGHHSDMFALWPEDNAATHAVFCVEGGTESIGTLASGEEKLNPSIQTIDLATGEVNTLLRGMNRCDGIRLTAWGTILATEETNSGQAYEIISPLGFSNHTVTDRAAGTIVDQDGNPSVNVAKRDALPTIGWEGLTVLESGVVIGGDELRPGTAAEDADGGAIFKFVPDVPADGAIADLAQSPLVSGSVFAMQVSCRDDRQQVGQGCEIGNAAWVAVNATTARTDADANLATGFYRPEDLHRDPVYAGEGIRFCWTNTGNEGASNFAEVVCAVDSDPMLADSDTRSVVINRFVEGDSHFNSFDNLAFQPGTGNLYVIEDHKNGDVWSCLRDGEDRDIKTDGCVRVLSVKDQSAEPTGFGFLGDGKSALLSIQHSDDSLMTPVDDYGTDDILLITGFGTVSGDNGIPDGGSSDAAVVNGARYDATQGEIFWNRGSYTQFNIYRDGELQNASANTGSSFYQNDLSDGVAYNYEVRAITEAGEISIGSIVVPGSR